jgi:hypothetical protein
MTTLKAGLPCGALLGLLAVLLAAPLPAASQSCTTIGSSTFCGARGSHNTVGNTVIFNNGTAGKRVGAFTVTGTPPRTSVLGSATGRSLAAPRTFTGVATPRRFGGGGASGGFGSGSGTYDSRIAALRAEILALEAQYQLQQMELTPAQRELGTDMPPALLRALTLAKQARAEAAESGEATPAVQ